MPSEGMPVDRRTVLKQLATTAAVGSGLASTVGSANAITREKDRLVREYHDERSLRSAFERHGGDLRATLVEAGFVTEDFDFRSLDVDLDPSVNGLDPTADDARAGVTAIHEDDTTTALATVSASSTTHDLALFVQPERDRAYAVVEPKSSDDRFLVTEDSVTPQGCSYQSCDPDDCCAEDYAVLRTYDCDADCTNCEVVDTDCACESCLCDDDNSLCTDSCCDSDGNCSC